MPNTPVPAAAEGLPGFQHPKLLEARRLLNIAPELERLNITDDGVRIIAGQHAVRRLAEEATETLIDLLDELEGDPDLEDNNDAEPSLGWSVDGRPGDMSSEDRELDPAEEEPSLGWTAGINQASRNWLGGLHDREEEHDGREPDEDREPSLGAAENHPSSNVLLDYWGQHRMGGFTGYSSRGSQEHWGRGGLDDREDDGDDREPDYDNEPECGI